MIPSFLCIPHIPVGNAGGSATQEQLPRQEIFTLLFLRVLRAFVPSCLRAFVVKYLNPTLALGG
jgi:hypothetical protein